jgi:sugar phosphate isomerase/epimerase
MFVGYYNDYDFTLIDKWRPALNCDGFELLMFNRFFGFPDAYDYSSGLPDAYVAVDDAIMKAKENGAAFYSMHMTKVIGGLISRNADGDIEAAVSLFTANCKLAVRYGVKLLVLHLWGGRESDKNIDVNIKMFPALKEISDGYGLTLTIENIVCNTHKPLTHMKTLWDRYGGDVCFTIDTRQAEFHKSLKQTCESGFLWENGLVRHLHISDWSGAETDWSALNRHAPLGSGDVDFDYFFKFIKSTGYGGAITIEGGMTREPDATVGTVNQALGYVKSYYREC